MDERVKQVETRRATVYLHQTSDGELHVYALLKFGRHVDRTVDGYEGFDMSEARTSANALWTQFR